MIDEAESRGQSDVAGVKDVRMVLEAPRQGRVP